MQKAFLTFFITISFIQCIFAQEFELIGTYQSEGTIFDIQVIGNYAYLASGDAGFEIVDISEPENPVQVVSYSIDKSAQLIFIENEHTYIYFASLQDTFGVAVFDITDLKYIKYLGSYYPANQVRDIAAADTLLFLACMNTGLEIVNVSSPANPVLLSTVEAPELYTSTEYLFINPPYCYTSCSSDKMGGAAQVVNISNPVNPIVEYEFKTRIFSDLIVVDSVGYIASPDRSSIFNVYNLSTPSNPIRLGQYQIDKDEAIKSIYDICIVNDYAFLLFNWNQTIIRIDIVDMSDPNNPSFAGIYNPENNVNCLDCSDDFIFLGAEHNLQIIKYAPAEVGQNNSDSIQTNLKTVYPNPFGPTSRISFSLGHQSHTKISIYNITGQLVTVIADSSFSAGYHSIDWYDSEARSGMYYVNMKTPEVNITKKRVFLK